MVEWKDLGHGQAFEVELCGTKLTVWQCAMDDVWVMSFHPITYRLTSQSKELEATTAEAAKREALHIVAERGKQVAVEAAELRGRMVGAEINAKGAGHDG